MARTQHPCSPGPLAAAGLVGGLAIVAATGALAAEELDDRTYYFGELHAHTGYSADGGSADLGNCQGLMCGNAARFHATSSPYATPGLVGRADALQRDGLAALAALQTQQQRLARLEKRFGLPNSAPSGERRPKTDEEDIGWPLDLNRPFDRESVDKATSFHDL